MRPAIEHAPDRELARSPAAARVGALAGASGLFLAHFEHRWEPDWPEAWQPAGRPDLGERATWQRGVLPETKFRSFHLDRLIGSFHPGHRPKWTAHELCHGLVGFGWRPDAPPLWLATASRLSEVLPVALWYFLDEAGLRRCPDHAGGGPLYNASCDACDAAAAEGPLPEADPGPWHAAGRAYVEDELAAVARSRRLGRPVPHRHATLELSSDGLAYVGAHGARLASPSFRRYAETFFGPGQGLHGHLDDLEERVLALLDHLCGEGTAPPLVGGRWRWVTQDLGWRLLTVMAQAEGEVVAALSGLVDRLATGPDEATVQAVLTDYRGLFAEYVLPEPGELFGVGYRLPGGLGSCEDQLARGLESGLPVTWAAMGEEAPDLVSVFAHEGDVDVRRPLGRRFAAWLRESGENPAWGDQASFEAAVVHAAPADGAEATLGAAGEGGLRVARGVEVLQVDHAVTTDPGAVEDGLLPLDAPLYLVVRRAADGEVDVFQVADEVADALQAGRAPDDEAERAALVELGVLVARRWAV